METAKILIVEDEGIVARNLEAKLVKSGYSVLGSVSTGEEAIIKAKDTHPDLILMDIKLQGKLTGIEAAEEILKFYHVPIVYLTSFGDKETFNRAISTQPHAYLIKPIETDQLSRSIQISLFNHKIQQEIFETKRRYELAVKAGKTGVWEYYPAENKILSDDNLLALFGYQSAGANFISENWLKFIHPSDSEEVSSKVKDIIRGNIDEMSIVHRVVKRDKSICWVQTYGKAFNGGDLITRRIIGTITDITDQKIAEEKLLQYADELKKINITKDKFFSIISHDLRNPFHTILGGTDLLANYIEDLSQDEIRDSAKNLYQSANNVYNLLNNLLEWARLQTGKFEIKQTRFDLCETVKNVISLYSDNILQKEIKIHYAGDQCVNVFADKLMIETTIRNMISNAIKFTNVGGNIYLDCECGVDTITVIIKDDGVGIAKEDQEKLFRIDAQFSMEGTQKEKGTGLGLILCKEFVEKNSGKIVLESEKGKGAAFKITLPLFKNN